MVVIEYKKQNATNVANRKRSAVMSKAKPISGKAKAYFINFAPTVGAALVMGIYALVVFLIRQNVDGFVLDQTAWEGILTYIPFAGALVVVAHIVRSFLLSKYDLSVIGIEPKEFKNSFFPIAIALVLSVVAIGFALKTSYIKDDVIYENKFMALSTSESIISSQTKWSLSDDNVYTLTLSNGKQFSASKYSQAGKQIEKIIGM